MPRSLIMAVCNHLDHHQAGLFIRNVLELHNPCFLCSRLTKNRQIQFRIKWMLCCLKILIKCTLFSCTDTCLQLHKFILNCVFCVELRVEKKRCGFFAPGTHDECVSVSACVRQHISRTRCPYFTTLSAHVSSDRGTFSSGGFVIRYILPVL